MVLTLKQAVSIAMLAAMPVTRLVAQRSPAPAAGRPGEVRPLLYGFALGCIDCAPGEGQRGRGGAGKPPVMSYHTFPDVIAIAPGSAAERSGIRAGDVLHSIDGLSVVTDAGATRLANAEAGQTVRLSFERASKPFVVSLVLGGTSSIRTDSGPHRIYGGYVAMQGGPVKLEVWSDDPIVPIESVDSVGTIILKIGTTTLVKVTVRKPSADSSSARKGPPDDGDNSQSMSRPLLSAQPFR